MSTLTIITLALAPTLSVAFFIYMMDRYDREPLKWLILAFFLGAFVIFIPSLYENLIEKFGIYIQTGNYFKTALYAFLGVGLSEELSKFLILRLFFFGKKFNNEPINAIVYAVMVSMGFASTENIFYIFTSSTPISTAIVRALSAIPAHAVFGVFLGYYMGRAKFTYSYKRTWLIIKGLSLAIIIHGAYDFFLFIDWASIWFHAVSMLILLISVILAIIMIIKAQRRSPFKKRKKWLKKIMQSKLPEFQEKLRLKKEEIKKRRAERKKKSKNL